VSELLAPKAGVLARCAGACTCGGRCSDDEVFEEEQRRGRPPHQDASREHGDDFQIRRSGRLALSRQATTVRGPCADTLVRPHPPLLIRRSVHPAVREAQRKLNIAASGSEAGPLVLDCIFGPLTEAAVRAFQTTSFPGNPREVDGRIGPHSWAKLDAVGVAPVPPPTPTPTPPPTPPPPTCGVPPNPDRSGRAFNPTTDSENGVIASHPIDALTVRSIASAALAAAASSGLPGLHLGPADAFRHALWNCRMAQDLSPTRAEQFATGHENSGPSSIPFDNQMDLHNNAIGRSLSGAADCATAVRAAMGRGELRTIRGSHTRPAATPPVPADCIGPSNQPWP
jgi:hypothetical protein